MKTQLLFPHRNLDTCKLSLFNTVCLSSNSIAYKNTVYLNRYGTIIQQATTVFSPQSVIYPHPSIKTSTFILCPSITCPFTLSLPVELVIYPHCPSKTSLLICFTDRDQMFVFPSVRIFHSTYQTWKLLFWKFLKSVNSTTVRWASSLFAVWMVK